MYAASCLLHQRTRRNSCHTWSGRILVMKGQTLFLLSLTCNRWYSHMLNCMRLHTSTVFLQLVQTLEFVEGLDPTWLKLQPIDIPKMGSEKAYSCNVLFEARNDCIGTTGARDRPCCQAVVQKWFDTGVGSQLAFSAKSASAVLVASQWEVVSGPFKFSDTWLSSFPGWWVCGRSICIR